MTTKYIYIHGLNSSKESFKFKILEKYFRNNLSCIEWSTSDNINEILQTSFHDIIENRKDKIVLIGDSTGCNFACQLQKMLKSVMKHVDLVLINPLFSMDQMKIDIMPQNVMKYLKSVQHIEDSLIIISMKDEVLDHSKMPEYITFNNSIKRIEDVHRCYTFETCIKDIMHYVDRMHL